MGKIYQFTHLTRKILSLSTKGRGGEGYLSVVLTQKNLQRFALKPKPRKTLKALLRNAFKVFLVVRLIDNCCKTLILG
jgi:hypothetical protein